mmetsp:Transcript_5709/g.16003  ORF Transcript_5709/g.16003 Transcript_5709/m.16003 type:complete len:232 (-) Transcript_5709:47-742(-)
MAASRGVLRSPQLAGGWDVTAIVIDVVELLLWHQSDVLHVISIAARVVQPVSTADPELPAGLLVGTLLCLLHFGLVARLFNLKRLFDDGVLTWLCHIHAHRDGSLVLLSELPKSGRDRNFWFPASAWGLLNESDFLLLAALLNALLLGLPDTQLLDLPLLLLQPPLLILLRGLAFCCSMAIVGWLPRIVVLGHRAVNELARAGVLHTAALLAIDGHKLGRFIFFFLWRHVE